MKVGMMICQDTPEMIWNAFRLANMMLEGMQDVVIIPEKTHPRAETDPKR
jgi:uncharacterized protein involved in oxidation of intracellular sulfur